MCTNTAYPSSLTVTKEMNSRAVRGLTRYLAVLETSNRAPYCTFSAQWGEGAVVVGSPFPVQEPSGPEQILRAEPTIVRVMVPSGLT